METFNMTPIPPLRAIIKNIWIVDYSNSNRLEKMIPFGCMDLVYVEKNGVTYNGNQIIPFSENEIFITGQVTKPYEFEYQVNTKIIGFGFYPHTGHLFTGISSYQLTDTIHCLSDLFPVAEILEMLGERKNIGEKIILLQHFILKIILNNKTNNRKQEYLQYMLTQIFDKKGHFDLLEVQKSLNISQRYIQSLFKDFVGVNPILYAKIIRFLNAIDSYSNEEKYLTDVALNLGYFDQSHFIRDFKRFTELTPKQYFKKPPSLLEQFTSNKSSSLLYNSI